MAYMFSALSEYGHVPSSGCLQHSSSDNVHLSLIKCEKSVEILKFLASLACLQTRSFSVRMSQDQLQLGIHPDPTCGAYSTT